MQATLNTFEHTGKIASNRKEKNFTAQYTVVALATDNTLRDIIQARIYQTASRAYACVWARSNSGMAQDNAFANGVFVSGGAYAGGYGYHRASAALEGALNDAGIVLSEAIEGRGEGAMIEALKAVAAALGYNNFNVFQAFA